jgi:hypothetical protein
VERSLSRGERDHEEGKCDASGALFVGLRYAQALAEPRLDGNDDGARIGIVKCNCQSFALKLLPARYENDQRNKHMWRMPRLSRSIRHVLN